MAITLTESAAKHVGRHLAAADGPVGLKLGVKTTGCSGFAYRIDFASDVDPADQVFESHGVRVYVSPNDLKLIDGTEVDFVRDGLNQTFRFSNPNAVGECGCGESFSV